MGRVVQHSLQSLVRGLALLESFAGANEARILTELAQFMPMNNTAVKRYMDTRVDLGYLGRNKRPTRQKIYEGNARRLLHLQSGATRSPSAED